MADWTAITGIVVAGAVGPAIVGWLANQRLRQEHENAIVLGDRNELRALLDEAERDLARAGRIAEAIRSSFMTYGAGTVMQARETIAQFTETMRQADLHRTRLELRLGDGDPVPAAYNAAWSALSETFSAVELAHGIGAIDTQEAWNRLTASGESYAKHHAEFLAAAHRLAASKLEPS